jgi:hypothetical protein
MLFLLNLDLSLSHILFNWPRRWLFFSHHITHKKITSVSNATQVGHEPSALTTARTFDSLYVQPILDTIKRENPTTEFVSSSQTRK